MDGELRLQIEARRALMNALRRIVVQDVLADRLPEDVASDTPLFRSGLGLDSIDAVELLVAIEAEFGVRLEVDRETPALAMRNLDSLADAILLAQSRR